MTAKLVLAALLAVAAVVLGPPAVGAVTDAVVATATGDAAARHRPEGANVAVMAAVAVPHVGAEHAPYTSVPPTSGPYVPQTLTPGVYRRPIPEELQVSALLRGRILVQYARGLRSDEVRALERIGRARFRELIVAPYPRLAAGIAVTSWARLERASNSREAAAAIDRIERSRGG